MLVNVKAMLSEMVGKWILVTVTHYAASSDLASEQNVF